MKISIKGTISKFTIVIVPTILIIRSIEYAHYKHKGFTIQFRWIVFELHFMFIANKKKAWKYQLLIYLLYVLLDYAIKTR